MSHYKAVLDTNVLVSSLISAKGNPAKIFDMFTAGELALFFNEDIIAEYEDVLYRPHLNISADVADITIAGIRQYGEMIQPTASTFEMIDEDDRIFYDTAKEAGAYLITGNLKHFPNEPHILSPAAFLDIVTT